MDTERQDGTVAVTGAGQGLGLAIAGEFLKRGTRVLALAECEDQVEHLVNTFGEADGRLVPCILDVTALGDFAFPEDLHVLVNNAGIRRESLPIEVIELDAWRRYFEVNFLGPVELCRRAIPIMRSNGGGTICNISSSSLCWPLPFLGPYRATKGAMAAFSETLRAETREFGIRVMEIMPGSVATGLAQTSISSRKAEAAAIPQYEALAEGLHAAFSQASVRPLSAGIAAARIADAIEDGSDRFLYGTDESSDRALESWRSGGGDPAMIEWIDAISRRA